MSEQQFDAKPATSVHATRRLTPLGWGVGMALVAGLLGPFVLWPVELVLPFPVLLEEFYKLWLVTLVLKSTRQNRLFWVFLASLGFGLSETVLYILNFVSMGDFSGWASRFVTAVPMHVVTALIEYSGYLIGIGPFGIVASSLIHWWFNGLVG